MAKNQNKSISAEVAAPRPKAPSALDTSSSSINPFTPVFGKTPAVLAGRELIIEALANALESSESSPEVCSIISGVRGSGKTTLLQYLKYCAEEMGWIVASTTAQNGMLEDILQRSYAAASHLANTKNGRKLNSIKAFNFAVSWENEDAPKLNFRSQITNLLDALQETDTGILFMVDEINGSLDEMKQLSTVFQHLIGENKKVALFMAGLPYHVSSLLQGKTTSFLRRAAQFRLKNLQDFEVEEAFELTVKQGGRKITQDALNLAVKEIAGFPFMLQLVGYRSWVACGQGETMELEHVKSGAKIAKEELKSRVFGATIAELSRGDIQFLQAMKKDGTPTTRAEIAQQTGRTSAWISKYKKRLLESGVIEETLLGDLNFSLPGFAEYLGEIGA